jgi:hypothetical protein
MEICFHRLEEDVMTRRNLRHLFGIALSMVLTLAFSLPVPGEDAPCADCAALGRTAADLQLKAIEASRVVEQAPWLLKEADQIEETARSESRASDAALDHARQYGNLYRDAQEFAQRTGNAKDFRHAADYKKWQDDAKEEFHKLEAKAKSHREEAQSLRDKANNAKANASKLEEETKNAWQAYHDCLKKAKGPGTADGAAMTGGISDCKQAQEWLDRANELHRMADRSRQFAKEASDTKTRDGFESEAKMLEGMARQREREAAYALLKCPPRVADAPVAPANAFGAGVPPGAIPLPRDSELKTTLSIKNDCPTAEEYRLETKGLPSDLIQTVDPMRVDTASSREFPLTYNTKGKAPGLYRGTIAIVCLTCNATCPRERKDFPIQFFIPE